MTSNEVCEHLGNQVIVRTKGSVYGSDTTRLPLFAVKVASFDRRPSLGLSQSRSPNRPILYWVPNADITEIIDVQQHQPKAEEEK